MPRTICSECGRTLPSGVTEGSCPRCLLLLGVAAADDSSVSLTQLRYFGDYELIEEIARGGMGVVWKSRQITLNRVVAVKMLPPGFANSREMVRRFQTEAEAAASLNHPGIVGVHEVGEYAGQYFFSMEYVAGEDLARRTERKPPAPEEAARILVEIADAIHHAHQRGVLHRDLKPGNILVDSDDRVRVTDFGLAKLFREPRELTATGKIMGTPGFMSPEQLDPRRGEATIASDIYGLGALLYFLLTGEPPFVAASLEQSMLAVLSQEPVSPQLRNRQVPQDLSTICLKCLSKEPSRRYASAAEVGAELGRFLRHEPIEARPVSATERLRFWARRNPIVAGLAVALVLTLVIAVVSQGFALVRVRRARDQNEGNVRYMLEQVTPQLAVVGRSSVVTNILSRLRPYFDEQSPQRRDAEFELLRVRFLMTDAELNQLTGNLASARREAEAALAIFSRHLGPENSVAWRTNSIATHVFLRDTLAEAGDVAGAVDHGLRAVELSLEGLRVEPSEPACIAVAADANLGLGDLAADLGRGNIATPHLEAGAKLAAELSVRSNAEPSWVNLYAVSHYYMGRSWDRSGDVVRAEGAFREYLRLSESLLALDPHNPVWDYHAAVAHSRVGQALVGVAKLRPDDRAVIARLTDEARRHAEIALQRFEALVARDPDNVQWQSSFGLELFWLADLLDGSGSDALTAGNLFRRSRDSFLGLVQREPERDSWAGGLARVLPRYAQWCLKQNQGALALEALHLNLTNQWRLLLDFPKQPSRHVRYVQSVVAMARLKSREKNSESQPDFVQGALTALPARDGIWRWSQAGLHAALANAALSSGFQSEAVSELQTTLSLRLGLFRDSPDEALLWPYLADTFHWLGTVQAKLGRADDAFVTASQALTWLEENPGVARGRHQTRQGIAQMCERVAGLADGEPIRSGMATALVKRCLDLLDSSPSAAASEQRVRDKLQARLKQFQKASGAGVP